MRVLICGDRKWQDYDAIRERIATLPTDSVVIEGDARGADKIAGVIAEAEGLEVEIYPADWNKYGRAAGPIRNKQMLDEGEPDEVWAFHYNLQESKGTRNMVEQAERRGIPVKVFPR